MLPQGMDEQQHDDDEQPHENVDHDGQDTAARIDAVNDGLVDDHLGLAGVEDTGVVIAGKHVGHRTLDIARRTLHILLLEHQQGQVIEGKVLPDGSLQVADRRRGEPVFVPFDVVEQIAGVGDIIGDAGQRAAVVFRGVVKRQQNLQGFVITLLIHQFEGVHPLPRDMGVAVETDPGVAEPEKRIGIGLPPRLRPVARSEPSEDHHLLGVIAGPHPPGDADRIEGKDPFIGLFDVVTGDQHRNIAGRRKEFHLPAAGRIGVIVHQPRVTGGRVDIVGDIGIEQAVGRLPPQRVVARGAELPAQRIGMADETLLIEILFRNNPIQFIEYLLVFALMARTEQGYTGHENKAGGGNVQLSHRLDGLDTNLQKKRFPRPPWTREPPPGHRLRADYPKISIFTSLRMSVDGTSTTGHPSCPSNTGFTVRPLTFTRRNSPAAGSWSR